jgi:hypothetical protein
MEGGLSPKGIDLSLKGKLIHYPSVTRSNASASVFHACSDVYVASMGSIWLTSTGTCGTGSATGGTPYYT